MKILVIGGTGHIGTHLVPMLISQGHEVYAASRGNTGNVAALGKGVHFITCDSTDTASLKRVADSYEFDAVIDFPGTGYKVWQAFHDRTEHIIVCGSLWMLGKPRRVPTPEIPQSECPFGFYADRYARIREMLADEASRKAAFTAILPSNICGPGKIPLDTMGGRSAEVHKSNMRGETVFLPDGPEALISPCDAFDLARLFLLALSHRSSAAGQIFNGGASYALTASEFVRAYGTIHGVDIPVSYVPWDEYKKINPEQGAWWHFYADMCPDISKAKSLLGYAPVYTPEEAMERAVKWMKTQGLI